MHILGFNTEWENLKERIELLQREILLLTAIRSEKKREALFLRANYETKIGVYEYERYKAFFECRKMRRKIEILQQAKNRNEKITKEHLEKLIEKEVREYEEQLKKMLDDINIANKVLNSPVLTEEEVREVKSIYKMIAKKLHPDLNPLQTAEMKELWEATQEAYTNNDLEALRDIQEQIRVMDFVTTEDLDAIEKLQARIDKLSERERSLKTEVEGYEEQFPWNQAEMLKSERKIEKKVAAINKDIEHFKLILVELEELYAKYELEG